MSDNFNRRDFLKIAAVTSTGAMAACSGAQPQKLIPYVVPPDGVVPGISYWYKSVCRECPAGCGIAVRTREGRAVKVEGNPEHPVNRGALCVRGQAAIQGLYNPDRITQPLRRNADGKLEPISWAQAEELLANTLRYLRFIKRADRIALVSHRVTGSMERLLRDWLAAIGSRQFIQYEPFAYEALRAANKICFGTSEIPHIDLSRARTVVSFGADFLETYVSNIEYTRQFAEIRQKLEKSSGRFVMISPRLSLTAANADEWIPCKPGSETLLAFALLTKFSDRLVPPYSATELERLAGVSIERLGALAVELKSADFVLGPGIAASGPQGTALQMLVNQLNSATGAVNTAIQFGRGADWDGVATHQQMFDFVEQIHTQGLEAIFFYHTNPAYALPEVAGFAQALARVPFKVSFASEMDETTALCDLILPDNTPLERWEDYEPRAGVYGLAQPAMAPGFYFQSKHTGDVILEINKKVDADVAKKFPAPNFLAYMQEQWRPLHKQFAPQKPFEEFWRGAVEAGGVWREVPARPVKLSEEAFRFKFPDLHEAAGAVLEGRSDVQPGAAAAVSAGLGGRSFSSDKSAEQQSGALAPEAREFDLIVYPSLQLFDGRGANRPWLQETPDAMTKIVWDAWAEIHPDTAQRLGISPGDLLKVTSPHGSIQISAHTTPGIRPDAIAIPLGQGHTNFGRWAEGHGPSPMKLLPAKTEPASGGLLWAGMRVTIEKLAVNRPLAQTQIEISESPDGRAREIVQVVPLSMLLSGEKPKKEERPQLSMYPPHEHPEHRWGMAIDLNACVGCNACVVACYAENNLHWMGKEQTARGRHMAWMRIDRYYENRGQNLETHFMPMLCQHCDNAPCESVCPVYATYHNHEGLNVQVYNRCVGTRYCSNNCPYKVRRFNWFDFEWPWPMQLGLNPDVSARSKGVMEKCTFCIQRIREAKDQAKDEKRPVRDGEITPACAQTCAAKAIIFGDLNDPESRVAQLAKDPRNYHVLGDLNTRPAISYLKKVKRSGE